MVKMINEIKLKKIKLLINEAIDLLDLDFQNRRIRDHLQMSLSEIKYLEKILKTKNSTKNKKLT